MNLTYLGLGVGLVLVGIIAASSGRRKPDSSNQPGRKAGGSPVATLGMFFLGLGLVLAIIGLG